MIFQHDKAIFDDILQLRKEKFDMPNKVEKEIKSSDDALVSVSVMPGRRNRSEHEGLPYGVMASHHNWPTCK